MTAVPTTLLPPGGGVLQHHHSGGSLSSQQGSNRISSDPESFTQDESDTGHGHQGHASRLSASAYSYPAHHHDNKPRSRIPLSPKVMVKVNPSSLPDGPASSTSHSQHKHLHKGQGQSQGQVHFQGHPPQQPLYHISEAAGQTQPLSYPDAQAQPLSYPPHQKQPRTRDAQAQQQDRNRYVNVQLNGYQLQSDLGYHGDVEYSPDKGYPVQQAQYNGYATESGYQLQADLGTGYATQQGLSGYDELYPSYPYKGYTLEETERLIQQAKRKNKLSYFDLLPDDVMIRILGNLTSPEVARCAGVCRRWYGLAWEPGLWTGIRLNDPGLDVDRALKQLTRRLSYDTPSVCVMVERINLNGSVSTAGTLFYMYQIYSWIIL